MHHIIYALPMWSPWFGHVYISSNYTQASILSCNLTTIAISIGMGTLGSATNIQSMIYNTKLSEIKLTNAIYLIKAIQVLIRK